MRWGRANDGVKGGECPWCSRSKAGCSTWLHLLGRASEEPGQFAGQQVFNVVVVREDDYSIGDLLAVNGAI